MKVKVQNLSHVEQRVRKGEGVEVIAAGKARILDLEQPEIERLRKRTALELNEIPAAEPLADGAPPAKKGKAKT